MARGDRTVAAGFGLGLLLTLVLVLRVGLGAVLYLPWFTGLGIIVVNFSITARSSVSMAEFVQLAVFLGSGSVAVFLLVSSFLAVPQ